MGLQTITEISVNELLSHTKQLKEEGFRLVAISCTAKDGLELSYSFDKDYDLNTLRFVVQAGDEIQSITSLYSYAFLYENEIKELFGANITNINIDFKDSLYKIPVKTPFNTGKEE